MDIKRFTLTMGIVFFALGVLGFVPALVTYSSVGEADLMTYGLLFGIFPVNGIHNVIRLALGIWAFVAYKDMASSRVFCKTNAIVYGAFAVLGLIPALNTLFGLVPLYGHNIWLHAIIAAATGFYGFVWHTEIGSKLSRQS